jgi:quinol monooxygenase YgiN
MPTLPWTEAAGAEDGNRTGEALVLGSSLALGSYRDIPSFLRAALRIRKQVQASRGGLGVSLIAQPAKKTFWTLSAWTDQESLDAFVRTAPHIDVMRAFHGRMHGSRFTTWTVPRADLPAARSNAKSLWRAAKERLATAKEGVNT